MRHSAAEPGRSLEFDDDASLPRQLRDLNRAAACGSETVTCGWPTVVLGAIAAPTGTFKNGWDRQTKPAKFGREVLTTSDRERLKATFDADPELYDRARPLYPPGLFDDLGDVAALGNHATVLEIGCGTGQATRPLAERGYGVFCVELGHNLAEVARTRLAPFRLVKVFTSPFETWDPAGRKFDLAFAATSWRWLDPTVRFEKVADVLKPNGALAIVTTHHVLPVQEGDPFFAGIQDSYVAIGEPPEPPPPPDEVPDQASEIAASNLFGNVQVRRYLACHTYTASDYISLLNTYSGHLTMKPSDRNWLYSEIESRIGRKPNARVRKHYLFILHVARLPPEG